MKVLDGIKVVDLSRVLAGPFCGQLLADFGATVIKVESPEGDENRRWPPMSYKGESANFTSVNRGKLGMALNLKNEGARKMLRQLAADADVLLADAGGAPGGTSPYDRAKFEFVLRGEAAMHDAGFTAGVRGNASHRLIG